MARLISRRILPLQLVGARAASAEHNSFRLTLALSADTADTFVTLSRTSSIAFDMGTESKLFVAPEVGQVVPETAQQFQLVHKHQPQHETFQPLDLVLPTSVPCDSPDNPEAGMEAVSRMCPRALSLGDADHALHHVMLELKSAFLRWDWFHGCLNSISKYFRSWSRLRRFCSVCIETNPRFSSARLKDSFVALFKTACPTLVEHRWEYLPTV